MEHIVSKVEAGSIAFEMQIEVGDEVLEINDQKIRDILDYRFLTNDTYLEVLIKKKDGEEWLLEIDKDYDEELGIEFENTFMDSYRSCSNNCVFCFIDQMPPGMRDTLYFKDDDSRLSFLQGNYITLTNLKEEDLDRLIRYRMEPVNISFHTTNEELRCKMLGNRYAGKSLSKVKRLFDAGIMMNGQIVLCKGLNDGEELERTISDLSAYLPYLESVSVVPVGLSKYRDKLYPLEAFTKEDAVSLIDTVKKWQNTLYLKHHNHFIHASDEWYILAGRPFPDKEYYDDYPQLENGVGMIQVLIDEVEERIMELPGDSTKRHFSLATGYLAAPFMEKCAKILESKYTDTKITVYPIRNDFFGEKITVSGLITGSDLIHQLSGQPLYDALLLPCNMLRQDTEVFLDDVTVQEVEKKLEIQVLISEEEGASFVNTVIGLETNTSRRRNRYEQTGSSDSGETECR